MPAKRRKPATVPVRSIVNNRFPWSRFSDERLLDLRLSDLGVTLAASSVERYVDQLYAELKTAGLSFRPHLWLSNEWFTPDRVPGIAVPFYLAHPRLVELERSQMLEVEGGTPDWCMRILRHEAGHAFDNAYLLHRRRSYFELFGDYQEPYPESYKPRPYTRQFVVHLDMWYAQAHPAEDFAETFAVWLNPRSRWRDQYDGWPAMAKVHYVQELMQEIGPRRPHVRTRRMTHTMRSLTMTLREHYATKRAYYLRDHPRFYDRDLRRIFTDDPKYISRPTAAAFLKEVRAEARMMISRWTGESQYIIDRTIADMIEQVSAARLRLAKPPAQAKVDVMMMLAVQTMNFLNDGRHRVVL
jgi:hypothetical protein